jgi:hypothetical protein
MMKNYIAYHDMDMETVIEAPDLATAYELANEFGLEVDSIVEAVQDRKTGEFYNPKEAFDAMMNKPEIQAVLKRLAVR